MTIRQKLHEVIKKQGSISYYELEQLCHVIGCKLATAERELRPSKSPQVRRVEKNGAIIRYEWTSTTDGYTAKQFLKEFPSKPKVEPPKGLF